MFAKKSSPLFYRQCSRTKRYRQRSCSCGASDVWFAAPARVLKKARVNIGKDGTNTPLAQEGSKYDFHESLPIGNGRLGAMDSGGVDLERVILNESTLWSGGDYDANK